MKRDYQTAIKSAVNGLYGGTAEDLEQALWEVLEALDPDTAELMHDDAEAARCKVNGSDEEDVDYDDEIEPLTLDDFEDDD